MAANKAINGTSYTPRRFGVATPLYPKAPLLKQYPLWRRYVSGESMTENNVNELLEQTDKLNSELLKIGGSIIKADNGNMYQMDFMSLSVINRSLELSKGFKLMIQSKYFLCAAPLLRLQLDNLLRYSAIWLVDNYDEVIQEFISGVPIRKIKDRSGKKMTDAHLVSVLSEDIDWIKPVYERTSGYIHLSESHFHKTLLASGDEGYVQFGIGDKSKPVPVESFIEAVEAYNAITITLINYASGWFKTKSEFNK